MTEPTTAKPPALVMTIGHSSRSLEALIGTLEAHGVRLLVDIRTVPRSRHNPKFDKESLPKSFAAGIAYEHYAGLGELRRARRDSPNTG